MRCACTEPVSASLCWSVIHIIFLYEVRTKGHISVGHLDDLYLQGSTYEDCIRNVIETTFTFFGI